MRPATNAQFEEYVRAVRQASQKQGLKNYWLVSQSVSGEPMYTVNLARRGGWPDVGAAGPDLVKTFGEKEAARLTALARSSIEGMTTAFYETQPDMSVLPPQPMKTPPVAVRYFFLTLKPGMGQQYAEGSRKTREAGETPTHVVNPHRDRRARRVERGSSVRRSRALTQPARSAEAAMCYLARPW